MQQPEGNPLVAAAIDDLSARLGIDRGEVTVLSHEAVTWPDGSVGCPQPDMSYTQVPVDGARTVLEAAGVRYSYHSGGRRPEPFLCDQPSKGDTTPPGADV